MLTLDCSVPVSFTRTNAFNSPKDVRSSVTCSSVRDVGRLATLTLLGLSCTMGLTTPGSSSSSCALVGTMYSFGRLIKRPALEPLADPFMSVSASIVMPSMARAIVASSGALYSTKAKVWSLDICTDMQGSMPLTTLRPLSCILKNSCSVASFAVPGRFDTNNRFDCRAFNGLRAAPLAVPAGCSMNAFNLLGSIGCWRGAPGSGNMPDSFACSAVTFS